MTSRGAVVLLPCALCLALGFVLGRRSADEPVAARPGHLTALAQELQLRPEQVAAVGALLSQQDRDLQELVEGARSEMSAPIAARLQRTEDGMLALLDADQRERYLTLTAASTGPGR